MQTLFGPPGTGKTTRLISELRGLLAGGLQPRDITYTAFTRVAADEAKARAIDAIESDADEDFAGFGTLHSICGRLLEFDWRNRLLSDRDLRGQALLRSFGRAEGFTFDFGFDVDAEADAFISEGADGNQLLAWHAWARQCCLPLETAINRWRALSGSTLPPERYQRFASAFSEFKHASGHLADFTDVLTMADDQAVRPWTKALILDEAQDLSPLQWRILDRWRERTEHVFLGADDDQAIYGFQGADARLILERAREDQITVLDQSYRLPRSSWSLATWLSSQISERQEKVFRPMLDEGLVQQRALQRASFDLPGTTFVLARNTYLLKSVRDHLETIVIPYTSTRGWDPYTHLYPAARSITALARGKAITRDDLVALAKKLEPGVALSAEGVRRLDVRRTRELPLTVGPGQLEELGFLPTFCERLAREKLPARLLYHVSGRGFVMSRTWTYLVRLQERYGDEVFSRPPPVTLSTIHGVKGSEADHVILLSDMAKASLRSLDTDPDSEHRVWYVGASRARKTLTLVSPLTDTYYAPLVGQGWLVGAGR